MPTYRDDIHLGHKVPTIETDDITNRAVSEEKLADNAVSTRTIRDKAVTNPKIADEAVDDRTLAPRAVQTRHIGDGQVTARKLAPCVEEYFNMLLNEKCRCMQKQLNELRQLVTSYTAHGIALSRCFGPNDDIGVTQRSLTNEVTRIWNKLNEITGEPGKGICVEFTPEVIISEDAADVQVTVTSRDEIFERVRIYVNDELAIDRHMTEGFVDHLTLTETSCVRTVAQILGREYTDIQIVSKLFPFFIGSGTEWQEVMKAENAKPYRGHLRGSYDMKVGSENDHIYVIFPTWARDQMIRVDMNGYEIAVTEYQRDNLTILESLNVYQAGKYNIDISNNCTCDCGSEEETEEQDNEPEQ